MNIVSLLKHEIGLECAVNSLCDADDWTLFIENTLFPLIINDHAQEFTFGVKCRFWWRSLTWREKLLFPVY